MTEKLKKCEYCTSPRKTWELAEDTGVKIIDCRDGKFYLQMYSAGIRIELQIDYCPKCGKLLQHNTQAADENPPLTRYEKIKNLSIKEVAQTIIDYNITDEFCKSDCEGCKGTECECPHDLECCVKWLQEEANEKTKD